MGTIEGRLADKSPQIRNAVLILSYNNHHIIKHNATKPNHTRHSN